MRSDGRRLIFEGVFILFCFLICVYMDFLFFLQSDGKEKKAWRRSQAAQVGGKTGSLQMSCSVVSARVFFLGMFPAARILLFNNCRVRGRYVI